MAAVRWSKTATFFLAIAGSGVGRCSEGAQVGRRKSDQLLLSGSTSRKESPKPVRVAERVDYRKRYAWVFGHLLGDSGRVSAVWRESGLQSEAPVSVAFLTFWNCPIVAAGGLAKPFAALHLIHLARAGEWELA
jgi:hypothetical protein